MKITIDQAIYEDKPLMRKLMEFYRYDFSEYEKNDLPESGEYGYKYLDDYWTEEERFPYLIRAEGKIAGFALVRLHKEGYFSMAEFFIMKKYRRMGIGKSAAFNLFSGHKGDWQVAALSCNPLSMEFWKRIISDYTDGDFHVLEKEDWDGVVYSFS